AQAEKREAEARSGHQCIGAQELVRFCSVRAREARDGSPRARLVLPALNRLCPFGPCPSALKRPRARIVGAWLPWQGPRRCRRTPARQAGAALAGRCQRVASTSTRTSSAAVRSARRLSAATRVSRERAMAPRRNDAIRGALALALLGLGAVAG